MCVGIYKERIEMQLRAHCSTHTRYIPIRQRATADPKLIYLTEKRRDLSTCLCTHTHTAWYIQKEKNNRKTTIANRNRRTFYYIHIGGDWCVFIIPKRFETDADGFPFSEYAHHSLGRVFYQTEIYGDTHAINRRVWTISAKSLQLSANESIVPNCRRTRRFNITLD